MQVECFRQNHNKSDNYRTSAEKERRMKRCIFLTVSVFLSLTVISFGQVVEFQVKSIYNTNLALRSQVFNNSEELKFYFDFLMINQTLDVSYQTNLSDFTLTFEALGGFVVSKEASPCVLPPNISEIVKFSNTIFKFYDKNLRLLGPTCDSFLASYFDIDIGELLSGKVNKTKLFDELQVSTLSINFYFVSFEEPVAHEQKICPLAFKHFYTSTLFIASLQSNVLSSHKLEFADLEETFGESASSLDLNCTLSEVWLRRLYRVEINSRFLNKLVFANTNHMTFIGVMGRIADDNVFKYLRNLKLMVFGFYNTREFFHYSNNRWLADLNYGTNLDPQIWYSENETAAEMYFRNSFRLKIDDVAIYYLYPDEDFCLFKFIPPHQAIFTLIEHDGIGIDFKKTCLFVYLRQKAISKHYFYFVQSPGSYLNISQAEYDNCHIRERLELCFNSTTPVEIVHDILNPLDVEYAFQWIEVIGPFFFFPIVSAIGLALNVIAAVIITRERYQTEFFQGRRLYKIILLNCIFNSLECFLSLLSVYGQCVLYSSLFCPSAYEEELFHSIRVYSINYLIESFKTCSIMTSLFFSLERFVGMSDSNNKFVRVYSQLSLKPFIYFILIFGFGTTFCKIFEDSSYLTDDQYEIVKVFYNYQDDWITIVRSIHYVVNDILVFSLNFGIDVALVIKVRKDLAKKKKLVKRIAESSKKSKKKNKNIDDIQKAQEDTNKMILLSLVLFLLCRLPELSFELHFLFNLDLPNLGPIFSYRVICLESGLCGIFKDTSQFLYIFTYCLNILLYYKFNKNFRLAFRDFFKMAPIELQTK